jgi:hypothetical protein
MNKESLQSIPLKELLALAREEGYEGAGVTDPAVLAEFILENLKERKREEQEENCPAVRVQGSKYQITESQWIEGVRLDLNPIEDRYDQTKIVLMVRDPHWAFAYWDLDAKCREQLSVDEENRQLVLRVLDLDFVDANGSAATSSFDIPIQPADSSWYIYLPNQNCTYLLELGFLAAGEYRCLARSNRIRTPRECVSETLPDAHKGAEPDLLLSDLDAYSVGMSSEAIPQRILEVRRE